MAIDYEKFERPDFKPTGASGQMITESLFLDTNPDPDKIPPVYTFREYEVEFKGRTLPSAYQVILYSTSEYDAAIRLLGSVRHWERLKQSPRVFEKGVANKPVLTIKIALEDMERRLRAEATDVLYEEAMNGNVTAAKLISGVAPDKPASKKEVKKQEEDKEKSSAELHLIKQFEKKKG